MNLSLKTEDAQKVQITATLSDPAGVGVQGNLTLSEIKATVNGHSSLLSIYSSTEFAQEICAAAGKKSVRIAATPDVNLWKVDVLIVGSDLLVRPANFQTSSVIIDSIECQ